MNCEIPTSSNKSTLFWLKSEFIFIWVGGSNQAGQFRPWIPVWLIVQAIPRQLRAYFRWNERLIGWIPGFLTERMKLESLKIISNDTKLEPISWELNAAIPLFIVCVGRAFSAKLLTKTKRCEQIFHDPRISLLNWISFYFLEKNSHTKSCSDFSSRNSTQRLAGSSLRSIIYVTLHDFLSDYWCGVLQYSHHIPLD